MTAYEAYKIYLSIKNHFVSDTYDYFKYGGKLRTTKASFDKRTDKFFFEKLAKHSDIKGFLVANFTTETKSYVRDLVFSESCQKNYELWNNRQQSLSYLLKNDLSKLNEDFDSNFICKDCLPELLTKYINKEVLFETVCLLVKLTNCIHYWDKHLIDDPLWKHYKKRIIKYTPFINLEKSKVKKIVVDYYS